MGIPSSGEPLLNVENNFIFGLRDKSEKNLNLVLKIHFLQQF